MQRVRRLVEIFRGWDASPRLVAGVRAVVAAALAAGGAVALDEASSLELSPEYVAIQSSVILLLRGVLEGWVDRVDPRKPKP